MWFTESYRVWRFPRKSPKDPKTSEEARTFPERPRSSEALFGARGVGASVDVVSKWSASAFAWPEVLGYRVRCALKPSQLAVPLVVGASALGGAVQSASCKPPDGSIEDSRDHPKVGVQKFANISTLLKL